LDVYIESSPIDAVYLKLKSGSSSSSKSCSVDGLFLFLSLDAVLPFFGFPLKHGLDYALKMQKQLFTNVEFN